MLRMEKKLFKLLLSAFLLTQVTSCGGTAPASLPVMSPMGSVIPGISTGSCVPMPTTSAQSISFTINGGYVVGTNYSATLVAGLIPTVSNNPLAGRVSGIAQVGIANTVPTSYSISNYNIYSMSLGVYALTPASISATSMVNVSGSISFTQSALITAYSIFGLYSGYGYTYGSGLCVASVALDGDVAFTALGTQYWRGTNHIYLYIRNLSTAYNYSMFNSYGYGSGLSNFMMPGNYASSLNGVYGLVYTF